MVPHWSERVAGTIVIGDDKQNGSLHASVIANVQPFPQIGLPLITRLDETQYPVVKLETVYRCRQELLEFPNQNAYNGTLVCAPQFSNLRGNPHLEFEMCSLLDVEDIKDACLQFIDIQDSKCVVSEFTKSRSCLQQAVWVRDLMVRFVMNLHGKGIELQDMVSLIKHHLRKAARQLNVRGQFEQPLTMADLPEVTTADSYQGNEKNRVFLCLIVIGADAKYDIGFMLDNQRIVMADSCSSQPVYDKIHSQRRKLGERQKPGD